MRPILADFRPNTLWVDSPYGTTLMELSAQLHEIWLPDHCVRNQERPGVIYHYTTADGLIGILDSNEVWATDLNYMSDASELEYARELIAEVIVTKQEGTIDDLLTTFYERALRMLEPPGSRRFYAVCFCENGDLLSQWRAYGGRGGGYAIGLQAYEIGLGSAAPLCIRKTIYDAARQQELVMTTLDRTEHVLMQLAKEEGARALPILLHFLDDHLSEYIFTFKKDVFQEEQEWRVVVPVLPPELHEYIRRTRFRNSNRLLVPYVSVDLGPRAGINMGRPPIARVVFGPTADRRLTRAALTDLLAKHGIHHVDVVPSAIPLRG